MANVKSYQSSCCGCIISIALGLGLSFLSVGCVQEGAVKPEASIALASPALSISPVSEQQTQASSEGEQKGWLNIGAVVLQGSAWPILAWTFGITAIAFWIKRRQARQIVDVMVGELENMNLPVLKRTIQMAAQHKNVEYILNQRVHKVRKKARKTVIKQLKQS